MSDRGCLRCILNTEWAFFRWLGNGKGPPGQMNSLGEQSYGRYVRNRAVLIHRFEARWLLIRSLSLS